MRIALIKDGIVENVIVAESLEKASILFPGYVCVDALEVEYTPVPQEQENQ